MNHAAIRHANRHDHFVLRFPSLFDGRGFAFPCDARGEVDVDALSPRARHNYVLVRNAVGRDFGFPAVLAAEERWH
jgi:hypothetical protein